MPHRCTLPPSDCQLDTGHPGPCSPFPRRSFLVPHAPLIVHVWLHRPTGAAGVSHIRRLPQGWPTAAHGERLMEATHSLPYRREDPWSPRTPSDIEEVLQAFGWRTISRAAAARTLTGKFTVPRPEWGSGIIHSAEPDDVTWLVTEFEAVAFAVRQPAQVSGRPAATPHSGRPLIRHTGYGRVLVLCPAGHLVQSVLLTDWSGSQLAVRCADPDFTVDCDGSSG
ncbi:hypothetical protein [Streptomyces sp. MI02-7b]|uniref:hypothetical protein n=1 Tax=Streptomyces sp. MI02-7b TaxID=462941 RepID=UPI0029A903B2|nr:hypothetical protein [Streptomyces sp. MI02-7b]MDX3075906.1 hypothetical protein [Streptomyces sp. MI02-7b]